MKKDISDMPIFQEKNDQSLLRKQSLLKPSLTKKGSSDFSKWEEVSNHLFTEESKLYISDKFFSQERRLIYDSFFILFLNKEPNEDISRFYKLCWVFIRFTILKSSIKTAGEFTDQKFYLIKQLKEKLSTLTDSEKAQFDYAFKEIEKEVDPKKIQNPSFVELKVLRIFIKQVMERAKISNSSNQKSKRSQLVLARIKAE